MLAIAVLASLLGVFVLLISIPIDCKFQFDSSRSPSFNFQIGWLFSLVKIDTGHKGKKSTKRPKRPRKKKKGLSKIQFAKLITKPLVLRFLRLAKDVFHSLHFKQINADIRTGLGEPADTGMLFGSIFAAFPFLAASHQEQIQISPDFGDEPVFEGSSIGIVRFWPIEIFLMILIFIFSKPVLRLIRSVILQWRSRK